MSVYWDVVVKLLCSVVVVGSVGCVHLSHSGASKATLVRPAYLEEYYSKGSSYQGYVEHRVLANTHYTVRRILLNTGSGEFSLDYFQLRGAKSKELILVFPVLGGKPIIENYLADYLVRHGFETAIIHRNDEFKNPAHFDNLEYIFRSNIVKDRIALDFFEREYG